MIDRYNFLIEFYGCVALLVEYKNAHDYNIIKYNLSSNLLYNTILYFKNIRNPFSQIKIM